MSRRSKPRYRARPTLIVMLAGTAHAGDVTSTRQVALPITWSTSDRWTHNPSVSPAYPNNGFADSTYDVVFPGNTVSLDVPVEIDNLQIFGQLLLNDQSISIVEAIDASLASFRGGTLTTSLIEVSSNATFDNVQATTTNLVSEGNASITLEGDAKVTVLGTLTFEGNGDIATLSGSQPVIDLSGATIKKTGGSGVTDITARLMPGPLTIEHNAEGLGVNSAIRFNDYPLTISTLTATLIEEISFRAPVTLGSLHATFPAQANSDGIRFEQDTTISGTITTTAQSQDTESVLPGVIFTSGLTPGSVSGGVLNAGFQRPIRFENNVRVGTSALVTNEGSIIWGDSLITGEGLANSGVLSDEASGRSLIIREATLTNVCGAQSFVDNCFIGHSSPVRLGSNGIVVCEPDTRWSMGADIVPENPSDVATARFICAGTLFASRPDISSLPQSHRLSVPAELSGEVSCLVNTIIVDHKLTTTDLEISAFAGSTLIGPPGRGLVIAIADNDLPPVTLTGDTVITTPLIPYEVDVLVIEAGDVVVQGQIRTRPSVMPRGGNNQLDRGRVLVAGTGTLSGGTVNLDTPGGARLIQTGGTVGESAAVTNAGRYQLEGGRIGNGGVINTGEIRIFTASPPPSVASLTNQGLVTHLFGDLDIESMDIVNANRWIRPRDSLGTSAVAYANGFSTGIFRNRGELLVERNYTIAVLMDNTGEIIADDAELLFQERVFQFDDATGVLSGGAWTSRNNGRIRFGTSQGNLVREVGPETTVLFSSPEEPFDSSSVTPWMSLETTRGTLGVTDGVQLDLRDNNNGGAVEVSTEADVFAAEVILRPSSPTALGQTPASILANRITNRGRLAVAGIASIQADTAIDLIDGGQLTGDSGTYASPLVSNISGNVSPGVQPGSIDTSAPQSRGPSTPSIGMLNITGDYTQDQAGTMTIDIAAAAPTEHDTVAIAGNATLDGTLAITVADGSVLAGGQTFPILTAASISGAFSEVLAPCNITLSYGPTQVTATWSATCGCNAADVSAPFGMLDIDDVLTFLNAFATADPLADVAPPLGTLDIDDVLLFLAEFSSGCP